ncbi:AAA domain-containing protein [Cercophora scortea]|uniref:AAA domain-containing protein n=1 Tax=Cercophora scortea TaxID=314031 RepID=A0AAE0M323_9PEZI|nr:AAA domain-containing protein [Cercophora scortea]
MANHEVELLFTSPPMVPSPLVTSHLRAFLVFGTSEKVGKTVMSTHLLNAARTFRPKESASYVKLFSMNRDDDHLQQYAPGVDNALFHHAKHHYGPLPTVNDFKKNKVYTDNDIFHEIQKYASCRDNKPGWLLIEMTGGAHSPTPTGTSQADAFAELKVPVILVGEATIDGVSHTKSAFESLRVRSYAVAAVLLFRVSSHNSQDHCHMSLVSFFQRYRIPVYMFDRPPSRSLISSRDRKNMAAYYEHVLWNGVAGKVLMELESLFSRRSGMGASSASYDSLSSSALASSWPLPTAGH